MSKQVRTLLVVTVLSIVGMFSLMMIAQRYGKILAKRQDNPTSARSDRPVSSAATRWGGPARPATAEGTESSEEQAARYIDAFIEVRRALVVASRGLDPQSNAEARLREARDVAIGKAGLENGEYKQVRQLYERWTSGSEQVAAVFEQAFEQRRDELEALRDERFESLDL